MADDPIPPENPVGDDVPAPRPPASRFRRYLEKIIIGCVVSVIGGLMLYWVLPRETPRPRPDRTPRIERFDVVPEEVVVGAEATLHWQVVDAIEVQVDPPLPDVAPGRAPTNTTLPLLGSRTIRPAENTQYTLTARSAKHTATSRAWVRVKARPSPNILSFEASPGEINAGDETTLRWEVADATVVEIDHGMGAVPLAGSRKVQPAETTRFTLTAKNGPEVKTARAAVSVSALVPAIRHFEATPAEINSGDGALLQWEVVSATTIQIAPGIGAVPPTGSRKVEPTETTRFTLTAKNANAVKTADTSVLVKLGHQFNDGELVLRDLFVGNSGWETGYIYPGFSNVFRAYWGRNRFRVELLENRSFTDAARPIVLGAKDDFLIEVTASLAEPADNMLYGFRWMSGDAKVGYTFMVEPVPAAGGAYWLHRNESWTETLPDGRAAPYADAINVLSPQDQNRRFSSPAVEPGTAPNKLAVVRRGGLVRLYINDKFVNQGTYQGFPVEKIGLGIGGQGKAEFRDLTVRVKRTN